LASSASISTCASSSTAETSDAENASTPTNNKAHTTARRDILLAKSENGSLFLGSPTLIFFVPDKSFLFLPRS